jgi:hypothetical protein
MIRTQVYKLPYEFAYGLLGVGSGGTGVKQIYNDAANSRTTQVTNQGTGEASFINVEKLNSKPLYRVMTEAELKAVQETGMLRGGREGTTWFTDAKFKSADTAQNRLSLETKPEYSVEFKIVNNPQVKGGTTVKPDYDQNGGGREYFTNDGVQIEIINVQKLK